MPEDSQIKIIGAGSAIRKIREQRGISVTELGERINISRSMMCRFEKDERGLTIDAIRKIAEALGFPSEQLLAACLFVAFPELKEAKIDRTLGAIVTALNQP